MKKNIGIVFLMVVIAALIIKIFWFPVEKETIVEIPKEAKEAVSADVKNINSNIDAKGFGHAVMQDKENVIGSTSQLTDSSKREVDSVKRLLKIKDKQLVEWIQYATTLEGKKLPAAKTDTGFFFRDKYAQIEFIRPKDTLSKEYFNFKYNAEINYAEYYKKDWFLGRKKHYIDFWIADTRATVNGVKRVKIQPKQDKVKVDVNASGFYTDRLNLGVDGGVTVGRTRLGGGYYYDMVDRQWKPLVSVKFRLLEF